MNSVLNPEAPEFRPSLTAAVQDGYTQVNKAIRASNTFPKGASHQIFKTFTDFNVVSCQISENVVVQSNHIMVAELPGVKLKSKDEETNSDKIIDATDNMLDRINVNIDTVKGVNKPVEKFAESNLRDRPAGMAAWNSKPVIAKIQVGSTTFIGAKNIPRPQLNFKDTIDNSDSLWVPKISDKPNNIKPLALSILYNDNGEAVGYEHPYNVELELYHPPAAFLEPDPEPPQFPAGAERTPLTHVDTEAALDRLVAHLDTVAEIAVDVEHHSYRTYQGFTCLIQISTNEGGDFIIDALAVREHVHKLNLAFTDPKKLKVFHGAEQDVVWLQRDFGVYVVGMFDTHHAAKALRLAGLSLKHLLLHYCDVDADKKYQLADWRMRPLPAELVHYARLDTHYLLYVWRRMKAELLRQGALLAVFDQSRQTCLLTYHKEMTGEHSHMPLYLRSRKSFSSQQMAALKLLYRWRDANARELDESPTYLLPNHMLLALADTLPREVQGVTAVCSPMPPFVKQHLLTVHRMILSCRELPSEPAVFRACATSRALPTDSCAPALYVHDLTHYPEYFEEHSLSVDISGFPDSPYMPEIQAFAPPYDTQRPLFMSDLNGPDSKMFITPFDRYRKYRTLAQIEEMKEFKKKEAKIIAISKGNELIKEEVLLKLQEAHNKAELEAKIMNPEAKEEAEPAAAVVQDSLSTKAAQRKRKMTEKIEQKDNLEVNVDTKKKDLSQKSVRKTEVEPFHYKNANYKKFFSDSGKEKKQARMKHKKRFNK